MAHPSGGDAANGGEGPRRTTAAAKGPMNLRMESWRGALKRTVREFKEDNLSDWAAALTYYGVLSLFPALLALVSIVGLLGSSDIQSLIDNVGKLAPGSVRDLLDRALTQIQNGRTEAGVGLAVGIVLLAAVAIGVVFTGSLARETGRVLGVGNTGVTVWNYAKWPVMVVLFSLVIAVLYWFAPNVRRGFRWITVGSVLAVLLWILASAAFAAYVANFGSYNKTYGSLAAIIIFLVWLWISNIALLLGLQCNAELERGRAIEAGHPPDEEPYSEPGDTRKL
ncbi:YihY/virulence factor BrkB family protein [Streptomyces sp. NPDC087420]|uniref:YihY/virulence factor BrkB family protein n=1 Tax=Streptomyces sp. NPDC087420 TaxID=3365785 RepID=UPI00383591D9